jgi:phosphoserine phosphatase
MKPMKYKLIAFDLDGTITYHKSSWQYIHERLGIWDDTAHIYQEQFLANKISYKKFCELDAAHWRGITVKKLNGIFKELPYVKNAVSGLKSLKSMGFILVAISTGLQFIIEKIKEEFIFDHAVSNMLMIKDGIVTGKVKINIGYRGKGKVLHKILKHYNIRPHEAISVGDSDGDISLARGTGYSIAINSASPAFSRTVDYECAGDDFKEVVEHIRMISFSGL